MATGRRPDPKRRANKHPHASYLAVNNGQKEFGYLAGEVFGCYGHRTNAQQPCLLDLTDDEMECPFCKAGMVPVWRGYTPLWDRDWTLRYVLIGEELFDSVDSIKHREQVEVSRAKNKISPLIVRPALSLVRELPDREPYSSPIIMLDVCLTLWKNDALIQWYHRNPQKRKASVSPVSLRADGKPFSPMMQAAAGRYTAPTDPAPADATFDEAKNRLKRRAAAVKVSENGNGKH